jgi:hypothetical protein
VKEGRSLILEVAQVLRGAIGRWRWPVLSLAAGSHCESVTGGTAWTSRDMVAVVLLASPCNDVSGPLSSPCAGKAAGAAVVPSDNTVAPAAVGSV